MLGDEALHQLDGPVGFRSWRVAEEMGHPLEQFQLHVAPASLYEASNLCGINGGMFESLAPRMIIIGGSSAASPLSSAS